MHNTKSMMTVDMMRSACSSCSTRPSSPAALLTSLLSLTWIPNSAGNMPNVDPLWSSCKLADTELPGPAPALADDDRLAAGAALGGLWVRAGASGRGGITGSLSARSRGVVAAPDRRSALLPDPDLRVAGLDRADGLAGAAIWGGVDVPPAPCAYSGMIDSQSNSVLHSGQRFAPSPSHRCRQAQQYR